MIGHPQLPGGRFLLPFRAVFVVMIRIVTRVDMIIRLGTNKEEKYVEVESRSMSMIITTSHCSN